MFTLIQTDESQNIPAKKDKKALLLPHAKSGGVLIKNIFKHAPETGVVKTRKKGPD